MCVNAGEELYSPAVDWTVSISFWSALCTALSDAVNLTFKGMLATAVRAG